MPSSVGRVNLTADMRRTRRPERRQHPYNQRSGRTNRLRRVARRRPRPRLSPTPQFRWSQRRRV